jgi:uncharacterized protein (TIGR02145 family)
MAQTNSKGEMPNSGNTNSEKQALEIKRNAFYNLEEIKVRWKKAALENCTGVPCIVTPPSPSFTCGTSTVSDNDLNSYNTVLIGTQCWTASNLKVTRYNDGVTPIPLNNTYTSGTVSTVWQGLTTGAYAIYGNESSTGANATNYGFLYNWYAAKGVSTSGSTTYKNICPTGWHVPTDSDWNKLVKFIDSGADTSSTSLVQSPNDGGKMKSTSSLWTTPNTGADNTSGFTVLPGGYRDSDGSFNNIRLSAFFWSATEDAVYSIGSAWSRNLYDNYSGVDRLTRNEADGASVRCLRD